MKPPRPREADPLPPPSEGSIEVDPWSLPPPEGGYETLDLDDGPAASAGAAGIAAADGGRAVPAGTGSSLGATPEAGRAEEERAAPAGRARSRGPVLAIVAAGVTLVGAGAVWLLRGGAAEGSGGAVRVTATQDAQEAPWSSTPPLAPVDPSYVERRRPDDGPARAGAATPPPPRAPAPRSAPAPEADASAAAAPPPPAEAEVAPPQPPPVPVQEPSAPAPSPAAADIPLPPPPVVAAPRPAAARARAPVLQTRTCVEDALRLPRGLDGRLPPELVVRVQVGADGRPGEVSVPGADSRLAAAVASAVRTCRFTPGAAGDGRPAAAPTTMRIRFE